MTHSMPSIFESPLKLVFSGAYQPCILANTSMARILSDALIFHGFNSALAMLISFSVAHAKFASIVLASFSFAGFRSSATIALTSFRRARLLMIGVFDDDIPGGPLEILEARGQPIEAIRPTQPLSWQHSS